MSVQEFKLLFDLVNKAIKNSSFAKDIVEFEENFPGRFEILSQGSVRNKIIVYSDCRIRLIEEGNYYVESSHFLFSILYYKLRWMQFRHDNAVVKRNNTGKETKIKDFSSKHF